MSKFSAVRRDFAARVMLPFILLLSACAGDRAMSPGPVTPPSDQPPPVSIAARYTLTNVNGQPLPAQVYAGVYQDESTGWSQDLRIVAVEGYIELHADGTFAHYVTMQTTVDGVLVGTPRYVDYGIWVAVPHSDDIRFESTYRQWPGTFHGVARENAVQLTQELTGGEAGAAGARYEYTRDLLQ
jgi:hypothetical protein